MSTTKPKGLFARLGSLFSGVFRLWVRDKEHHNPEVVYEQAIVDRKRQYKDLKQAVAGILFMRNKLQAEIEERRMEIARLHDDIRRAVKNGQDELSLSLITHKQELFEQLERAENEFNSIRNEAVEAKDNLMKFREEITTLINEKGRMIAKLANIQTRRRLRTVLDSFSVESDMAALDNVREYIARSAIQGQLEQEVSESGFNGNLQNLRREARREAAQSELWRIKREISSRIFPERTKGNVKPIAGTEIVTLKT